MFYIILLSLLSLTLADVTLYQYKPFQTVYINNKKLRETINSQYFAYPGYHKLSYPLNYSTRYFNSNKYFYGSSILKDYIIKGEKNIGSIKYYYHDKHVFHYIVNLVLSDIGIMKLYHNKIPIIIRKNKIISIYDSIILNKGYHTFDLEVSGNMICNCPSYFNGYQQTRYFFGWIDKLGKKNNTIFSQIKLNNIIPIKYSIQITK